MTKKDNNDVVKDTKKDGEAHECVGIYDAIATFQKSMPIVKKDTDNPYYGSKYADLASIMRVAQEHLENNHLVITHHKEIVFHEDRPVGHKFITTIHHRPSGQKMQDDSFMPFDKPQAEGSDITYCRRYAITSMLNIIVEDDDDDGNHANDSFSKMGGGNKGKKTPPPLPPRKTPSFAEYKKGIDDCDNLTDLQALWLDVQHNKEKFTIEQLAELEVEKNYKKTDLG